MCVRVQVRVFGRNGCESRVVALRVMSPSDPAKVLAVIRAKVSRGWVHCAPGWVGAHTVCGHRCAGELAPPHNISNGNMGPTPCSFDDSAAAPMVATKPTCDCLDGNCLDT